MTLQSPISLESIKLSLISNPQLSNTNPALTKDGIRYLLKALIYADAAFSLEIENVLVKVGQLAVPELIKSLASENLNVRSVSAMALIRLGNLAEEPLLQAYPKFSKRAQSRWVLQFILQELGLSAPHTADEVQPTLVNKNKVALVG